MKRRLRTLAVTIIILGLLLVVAWQPEVANHFGYALPGSQGLPFRLSYAGRHYSNSSICAGAGWCRVNGPPQCTTAKELRSYGYWPLQQAGLLFTLFGPVRSILRDAPPRGMTTMALYVPIGHDCYLTYDLEGGP